MLAGTKVWAFGHLLATGFLHDVVLFGGFLIWAIVLFIVSRRRDRRKGVSYARGTVERRRVDCRHRRRRVGGIRVLGACALDRRLSVRLIDAGHKLTRLGSDTGLFDKGRSRMMRKAALFLLFSLRHCWRRPIRSGHTYLYRDSTHCSPRSISVAAISSRSMAVSSTPAEWWCRRPMAASPANPVVIRGIAVGGQRPAIVGAGKYRRVPPVRPSCLRWLRYQRRLVALHPAGRRTM